MITERTKAIMLLTAYFSKDQDKVNKPLSLTEWNKVGKWLQHNELGPEAFLSENSNSLLDKWSDQSISKRRLSDLLNRKTALALALDKWTRAGVWVISRGDQSYPQAFKKKLKSQAPNILFGIGNPELLNKKYIGVVGSRNASDIELQATKSIGQNVRSQSYGIVSGGAKGVDEAAMMGVLEAGGECVGFLADSLLKKSTSSIYRNYIIENKLVLITPFNPEAGFNAGNAMSRNKLIYALAHATIVMVSDIKGGTWEGAKENLKHKWTPTFVWPSESKGNSEIVNLGGKWLSDKLEFDINRLTQKAADDESADTLFANHNLELNSSELSDVKVLEIPDSKDIDFFNLFIYQWFINFKNSSVSLEEITEKLRLTSVQADQWIRKACEVRYAKKSQDNATWLLTVGF